MGADADAGLRENLLARLNSGLSTEWQQRAYTSEEVNRVVARLQQIPAQDYAAKLTVAGFTPAPFQAPDDPELEQGCSTCMYFERNRQFCNLPELKLPVMPEWSCRLWRI